MDSAQSFVESKRLERVQKALEKNLFVAYIAEKAGDVNSLLKQLIREGETVTYGGSMTLNQCKVKEMLREGNYNLLDRDAPGADRAQIQHDAFSADTYLASANAITEAGQIYEIDGIGNRVAAIAYGPASVILIAGRNKIVPDLEAARRRNNLISGPTNVARLNAKSPVKTPCATLGTCTDCNSPDRVCCSELVLRFQRNKGRIKIILVNEELGY